MSSSSSASLDEAVNNGCWMLMLGVPVLFVVVLAFGVASWPCRIVMGLLLLAFLLRCFRRKERQMPAITYLPQPNPGEPLITLQPGQLVTVPWPHTLQVHLPEGGRLQVVECTPERIRVVAVKDSP